jgi:hypothetical protein
LIAAADALGARAERAVALAGLIACAAAGRLLPSLPPEPAMRLDNEAVEFGGLGGVGSASNKLNVAFGVAARCRRVVDGDVERSA